MAQTATTRENVVDVAGKHAGFAVPHDEGPTVGAVHGNAPFFGGRCRSRAQRRAGGEVLQEELRKYPRGVRVDALLKATTASDADMTRLRARRIRMRS